MASGKKIPAIAEGYIPNGAPSDFISHGGPCILSTSDEDAHVQIMLYFTNKETAEPYNISVAAMRTKHLPFNRLTDRHWFL